MSCLGSLPFARLRSVCGNSASPPCGSTRHSPPLRYTRATELPSSIHWPYLTALKLWTTVVGTSEVALRIPSVAGAVLSAVLLTASRDRCSGTGGARVVAPSRIEPVCSHGLQARGYTILLALSIACTWLFVRVRERDEIPRIVAYTSVALLLVLWQFFSGVLLLAVHAFVARRSRRVLLWLAPVAWSLRYALRKRTAREVRLIGSSTHPGSRSSTSLRMYPVVSDSV